MTYQIVFNARAEEYLANLPSDVCEAIEDALDALENDPTKYEHVEFRTAFLITVAGHDIAWIYSAQDLELIVASVRPVV